MDSGERPLSVDLSSPASGAAAFSSPDFCFSSQEKNQTSSTTEIQPVPLEPKSSVDKDISSYRFHLSKAKATMAMVPMTPMTPTAMRLRNVPPAASHR